MPDFDCLIDKQLIKNHIIGTISMISEPPQSIEEIELIHACRKGDENAFRKVIAIHKKQVRRTVFGMLGETSEAEDVAQEVFIRFFRSLNHFREKAKLSTYLVRIAINLSLNELKRRERRNRWFSFVQKEKNELKIEDPGANPEKFETQQFVQKALQLIDADFRVVIVLRLLDGYSVKEVAKILQLPEGTVCSRLARGQKKLKAIMEKLW